MTLVCQLCQRLTAKRASTVTYLDLGVLRLRLPLLALAFEWRVALIPSRLVGDILRLTSRSGDDTRFGVHVLLVLLERKTGGHASAEGEAEDVEADQRQREDCEEHLRGERALTREAHLLVQGTLEQR